MPRGLEDSENASVDWVDAGSLTTLL